MWTLIEKVTTVLSIKSSDKRFFHILFESRVVEVGSRLFAVLFGNSIPRTVTISRTRSLRSLSTSVTSESSASESSSRAP